MSDYYVPERKFKIISINTAFRKEYPKDFYFAGERHDFWELVYVIEGEMIVAEDNEIYELSKGQAVFHKPMEFHRLWSRNEKKSSLMIISFKAQGDIIDDLGNGIFSLDLMLREQLMQLFWEIGNSFSDLHGSVAKKEDGYSEVDELSALLKLELFLLSVLAKLKPDKKQWFTAGAINYRKIINTMTEHLHENLSTDELAAYCRMGKSNLKKTFKLYSGCGVINYFNRMKISKSVAMLRDGKSISEISEKLGFSSPNYFSAVYKKEMSVLPSEYRKRI